MNTFKFYVEAGGLMSYGVDTVLPFRRAGLSRPCHTRNRQQPIQCPRLCTPCPRCVAKEDELFKIDHVRVFKRAFGWRFSDIPLQHGDVRRTEEASHAFAFSMLSSSTPAGGARECSRCVTR